MLGNKHVKKYSVSVPRISINQYGRYIMNTWDLPSSLSTSFCNFCTDLSANSARASAWWNKYIVKNHHFITSLSITERSIKIHKPLFHHIFLCYEFTPPNNSYCQIPCNNEFTNFPFYKKLHVFCNLEIQICLFCN